MVTLFKESGEGERSFERQRIPEVISFTVGFNVASMSEEFLLSHFRKMKTFFPHKAIGVE